MRELTSLLLPVPPPSFSKSHQGPEVGSEHRPAEGGGRVDAHQPTDEGVFAALQQRHNVRAHVVRVLLPEILRFGTKKHSDTRVSVSGLILDETKKLVLTQLHF